MDDLNFIYDDDSEELKNYESVFSQLVRITKDVLNINNSLSMSINYIKDEKSLELNKKYRNKDYIGDVISFPIDDDYGLYQQLDFREIGDIFITYQEAKRKADHYNHDIKTEMCWLFVHGLLHILGYDHELSDKDEEIMFALTDKILNKINVKYKIV